MKKKTERMRGERRVKRARKDGRKDKIYGALGHNGGPDDLETGFRISPFDVDATALNASLWRMAYPPVLIVRQIKYSGLAPSKFLVLLGGPGHCRSKLCEPALEKWPSSMKSFSLLTESIASAISIVGRLRNRRIGKSL